MSAAHDAEAEGRLALCRALCHPIPFTKRLGMNFMAGWFEKFCAVTSAVRNARAEQGIPPKVGITPELLLLSHVITMNDNRHQ